MMSALVPEQVPVRVHSPVGLVSFHPREKVSRSNHSVMRRTLSTLMMSGTSGRPSMEATKRQSSAVEAAQAPAPERVGMSLPP